MKRLRRKKRIQKDDIISVSIIIGFVIIIISLGIVIYQSRDIIKEWSSKMAIPIPKNEEDIPDLPYVLETRYIGGIGYDEVYEYPFCKNEEIYKMNKQLWKDHPDRVTPICNTAKDFMNKLLNVSARDIVNSDEYTDSLYALMDPDWRYDEDITEGGYSVEEHLEQWKERIIDNNISIESTFLTDTSLVYVNGLYYVRGILEYTVYESEDPEIPIGDKKAVMVEVALHISNEVSDDFDVVRVEVMDTENIPVKQ